jgi:hypothetical protein
MGIPDVNGDTPVYTSPNLLIVIGSYTHINGPYNCAQVINAPNAYLGLRFGSNNTVS